jgi:pimeloyl-ACP methyl ester carboxylesterase
VPNIIVNGITISYSDTGGTGPAVVFSHGLLMDGDMFADQVKTLAPAHRCITWDQRGFGGTGPVAEPFDYWDSARDALALMSALGIASANLVGLSQGGFLSMRAALLEPERVDSLVLLATRPGLDSEETNENFRQLNAEWRRNGVENLRDTLTQVLLGPDVDPAPWLHKWDRMGKADMDLPLRTLMERDDLTASLPRLTCPSLVLHGTADIAIDIAFGRQLAEALPNCAGLRSHEGAGHAVNLARPAAVSAEIAGFLAGTRA